MTAVALAHTSCMTLNDEFCVDTYIDANMIYSVYRHTSDISLSIFPG